MAERAVNIDGIPLDEIFESEEIYRLGFVQWLKDHGRIDGDNFPTGTVLTDIIPYIHVIDTANRGQLGEFFNRHRRRGPQRRPGDPGYESKM